MIFSKGEALINGETFDLLNTGRDCYSDDLIVFEEDNVFRLDEGSIACPEPRNQVGTWFMNNQGTEVISIVEEEITVYEIIEITSTQAIFSQEIDLNEDGNDDTATLTFIRQ